MQVSNEDKNILTFVVPEIKLISPTRVLNLKDIDFDASELPKGTSKKFTQEVISPAMLSTGTAIRQAIRDHLDRVAILTDKGYLVSPNSIRGVQDKFDDQLIRFEQWITRIEEQYPARREEFLMEISSDPALQNIEMKDEFLFAVSSKTPLLEKVLDSLNFDYSMFSIPAETEDRKGRKNPLDTAINRLIDEITSGCKSAYEVLEGSDRARKGTVEKVAHLARKAESFSFLSSEMRNMAEGLMANVQRFLIGSDLKGSLLQSFREMTRYLGNREHFLGCYENGTQVVPDFVFGNGQASIGQSLFETNDDVEDAKEETVKSNANTSDIDDLFGGSMQLPQDLYDLEPETEEANFVSLEEVEEALEEAAEEPKSKDLGNSVLSSLKEELNKEAEASAEVDLSNNFSSSDVVIAESDDPAEIEEPTDEILNEEESIMDSISEEEIVDFDEMPDYESFDDFSGDDFENSFFS